MSVASRRSGTGVHVPARVAEFYRHLDAAQVD